MTRKTDIVLFVLLLGLLTPSASAQIPPIFSSPPVPDFELSLAYDSKYVTEGRDNLGDGGLFSYELAADFSHGLSGGVWSSNDNSDQVDYKETNILIEYGFSLHSLNTSLSYTFLHFNDDPSDHEIQLGIVTTTWPITLALDTYHSTNADGSFVELSASYELKVGSNSTITPYVIYGLDYGYATPYHDGENHFLAGINIETVVRNGITLFGYLNASFAGDDIIKEGGSDLNWGGVGISFSM